MTMQVDKQSRRKWIKLVFAIVLLVAPLIGGAGGNSIWSFSLIIMLWLGLTTLGFKEKRCLMLLICISSVIALLIPSMLLLQHRQQLAFAVLNLLLFVFFDSMFWWAVLVGMHLAQRNQKRKRRE